MNQIKHILALGLMVIFLAGPQPLYGQEISVEDVMVRVLVDSSVSSQIKKENVYVLLGSKAGSERLAEILESQNNNETRKLICQVISGYNPGGIFSSNNYLPTFFIEPLFVCLYSEDRDLSDAAGAALAVGYGDQVLRRLAATAVSSEQSQKYRLAAIAAVERISGREALLVLTEILNDKDSVVRDRAIDAVCNRLVITKSEFDVKRFLEVELPNLRWMSDKDFLLHQARRLSQNIKLLNSEIVTTQQQVLYWQAKFLRAETDRFNSLTPENKMVMLQSRLEPSQDKPVRQWAASQLVTWGNSATARDGAVGDGLVKLLGENISDSEDFVRSSVAEALGVFGYKAETAQLVQRLLDQLKIEKSLTCQRAMLNTLGQLQFTPALEQCIIMWEGSESDEISAAAVSAAGKIAGKIDQEESNRIALLVKSITDNIFRCANKPALKVTVYQAIRRIIETGKWRDFTSEAFDSIVTAGLKDDVADVRSMSVYSFVSLRGAGSVEELLKLGLLDDPEAAVRFAIITAIDGNSSPRYLASLKSRFMSESSSDVKGRLQEAIRKILAGMKVEEVYNWGVDLVGDDDSTRVLRTQATAIMVEKVATMKTTGESVLPKYEILILSFNVDDYLRKSQYEQAGRTIVDLLNYELTNSQRVEICKKLFNAIFDSNINLETRFKLIELSQAAIPKVFVDFPDTLTAFEARYDVLSNAEPSNVLLKAKLVKQYIAQAENGMEASHFDRWLIRRKNLVRALVDLALSDESNIDQNIITALKGLDSRFANLVPGPEADLPGQRAVLLLVKQSEPQD